MRKIKFFTPLISLATIAPTLLITSCGNNNDPIKEKIEVTAPSSTLDIEKTMQLTAKMDGEAIDVNWTVNETKYATIDDTGLLTAIDGGRIKVTATAKTNPELIGTIDLTIVGVAVKSVDIVKQISSRTESVSNLDIKNGLSDNVLAKIYPTDATYQDVEWSSDDEGVATITNGQIQTIGLGVTKINVTTTHGQKTDSCQIKSYDDTLYQTKYQDWIGYWLWATEAGKSAKTIVIPFTTYILYIKNPNDQSVGAFEGCTSLESIYFPDRFSYITSGIGARAFYGCTNLNNIYYDSTVSSWKQTSHEKDWHVGVPATFVHCTDGDAYLDEQYTTYSHFRWNYDAYEMTASTYGFETGKEVENVVIPIEYELAGSVKFKVVRIDPIAFEGRSIIKMVSIPYTVTTIGSGAFRNCTNLTSLTLENRVTTIGSTAFYGCDNLDTIIYRGTKEQFSKITLGQDWAKNIKTSVVHCEDGDVNI